MNILHGRPKRLGKTVSDKHVELVLWTRGSIVASVARNGLDVVVDVVHIRPWDSDCWRWKFVYDARVRFVNAPRIISVFVRNLRVECRLAPGWEVDGVIKFNGIKAMVPTQWVKNKQNRDCAPVTHTIYCDDVVMTTRLRIRQTLKQYFFRRSRPRAVGEPPASPPIEGQEWWPPAPEPSREKIY